jgi:hypothetical protein
MVAISSLLWWRKSICTVANLKLTPIAPKPTLVAKLIISSGFPFAFGFQQCYSFLASSFVF